MNRDRQIHATLGTKEPRRGVSPGLRHTVLSWLTTPKRATHDAGVLGLAFEQLPQGFDDGGCEANAGQD
jgi:hypothetical protein